MKKYLLFIRKYNLIDNNYIVEQRIVETNDIYHTIGYIYSTSIVAIRRIDYMELKNQETNKKC